MVSRFSFYDPHCHLYLVNWLPRSLSGGFIKFFGNTPGHVNHWSRVNLFHLLIKYFTIIDYKQPIPWNMVLVSKK